MRWLLRIAIAALVVPATLHAEKLLAPSAQLRDVETILVSGEVERVDASSYLYLREVRAVHGDSAQADALRLRGPKAIGEVVVPGAHVLLAYLPFRRDPMRSELTILDPDGPKLLYSPGLEPAVFRDEPLTRSRLLGPNGVPRSPRLQEILDGIADADPQWQNYYANELALRPRLWQQLAARDLERLATLLANRDASPTARAAIFDVARSLPATDLTWWHGAGVQVIREQSVQAAEGSATGVADLVRVVFIELAAAKIAIDERDLARWVVCGQTALVENALLAARSTIPEREDALIAGALRRTLLRADVRVFLLDHQRRLNLMRASLASDRSRVPN